MAPGPGGLHCLLRSSAPGKPASYTGLPVGVRDRLSLKLVSVDGRCQLSLDDLPGPWWRAREEPSDLHLRLLAAEKTSATVYRGALRAVRAEDLAEIGWGPLTPPVVDPAEAARRLGARVAGLPGAPARGERFLVPTTGRPMAWVPPGELDSGPQRAAKGTK